MKTLKWLLVILFLLLAGGILLSFTMGNGSRWLARRWTSRLESVNSLQDAERRGLMCRKFADGSWLCGIVADSHGNPWGGTVVTKDSNGRARVYFGHVCGPAGVLGPALACSSNSLAEAYSNLLDHPSIREQQVQ
jgi:hypothetical protein